jgi:hypothetical protein
MTSPLQQKLRITGPVVITANRLGDGAVIYRTSDHDWTTRLSEAAVVTTEPAARQLLTAAVADDLGAVGAYVAPVQVDREGIHPGNLRERIRHTGPTIELPVALDDHVRAGNVHAQDVPLGARLRQMTVDLPGGAGP